MDVLSKFPKLHCLVTFSSPCSLQRNFDQKWLSMVFAKKIFIGNGLIAIVSGLVGNLLVHTLEFGPVAPFDAAGCFLAIGMVVILATWTENYGDPSENKSLLSQFKSATMIIASGTWMVFFLLDLLQKIVPSFSLLDCKSSEHWHLMMSR